MKYTIRFVVEEDAPFILSLRNNPRLNKHLSPTSVDLNAQQNWIRLYKEKERRNEEFYFIISEDNEKVGLYRLYHINNVSFTIGSWLFKSCLNKHLPILTDLVFSDVGFKHLQKDVLLFDVRKANKKVLNYHLIKKPLLYNEDELSYFYLIIKNFWENAKLYVLNYFGIDFDEYETFRTETGFPYI